jgi:hypothetical protein
MKDEAFSMGPDAKDETQVDVLAIPGSNERICDDTQPILDQDYIKRFCQGWGEIGRAILNRRDKYDNVRAYQAIDYPRLNPIIRLSSLMIVILISS